MKEAFIIDAVRTPVGKIGGTLSPIRADDMAALVIEEILRRNESLDPAAVEDVIMGCANQAGEDNRNVARMALLLAGLPQSVPGETVNRLCASGLSAAASAARALQVGQGDVFIAGGVEQMTRAPYVLSKPSYAFGRDAQLFDTSLGWRFVNPKMKRLYGCDAMGETAENVAEEYSISREDQDRFALRSQQKAAKARGEGRFLREIVPVEIPQRKADPILFQEDEYIRPDTSLEALSKLRTVFRENGCVTAGNASGLNDGACAVLLASPEGARRFGFQPRARFITSAVVGVEPRLMGMGPVDATRKVLDRAGLALDQIDVIELNEAFAAQSLACLRQLGVDDDDPRVNPNGGAIALGHPLGMSGARLLTTALNELEAQDKRYALCTLCVGVGQGMAAVIERL
ncbi:MAG TPA: 3-oxoadipyl-CoA thiolase [Acidobacteriota bacterium]|nr:3-oxoadipyl-CoA thiolase [Acidobacteriota bacterium]